MVQPWHFPPPPPPYQPSLATSLAILGIQNVPSSSSSIVFGSWKEIVLPSSVIQASTSRVIEEIGVPPSSAAGTHGSRVGTNGVRYITSSKNLKNTVQNKASIDKVRTSTSTPSIATDDAISEIPTKVNDGIQSEGCSSHVPTNVVALVGRIDGVHLDKCSNQEVTTANAQDVEISVSNGVGDKPSTKSSTSFSTNIQCGRTTSVLRCPLPIMIGGDGFCSKHISKKLFQLITGND